MREAIQERVGNPYHLGMFGLAMVLALAAALVKPTFGLALAAGFLIFLVTLVSAQMALYLLIISMVFSPEITIGGTVGKGVGGRTITLRFEDLLLLVMGFAWLVKSAIYKELPLFKWTPLNGPMLYYILACVLSTMIGMLAGSVTLRAGFFFVLKYFEYFFLFYMVVNHVTTKDQVVRCLVLLLLTCVGASLFGLAQIPSGERATLPFEGAIGEPNTFGGYLVLMMALVLGLVFHLKSFPTRVALLGLLVCMIPVLMATLSRSSYAAAGVLTIMVVYTQRHNPKVLGALMVGVMSVMVMAPNTVGERIMYTVAQPKQYGQLKVGGIQVDTSTSDRIRAWQDVLGHWAQRPLLGKGVASIWWADAMYVKVLAETGIIGLTAFLFFFVRLWKTTKTTFHSATNPWEKGLTFGFLLGILPLMVHAIGANTFYIVRIMEPFCFLAALVVLLPMLEGKTWIRGGSRMTEKGI